MRQFELNTKMHYCLFEVRIAGQDSVMYSRNFIDKDALGIVTYSCKVISVCMMMFGTSNGNNKYCGTRRQIEHITVNEMYDIHPIRYNKEDLCSRFVLQNIYSRASLNCRNHSCLIILPFSTTNNHLPTNDQNTLK